MEPRYGHSRSRLALVCAAFALLMGLAAAGAHAANCNSGTPCISSTPNNDESVIQAALDTGSGKAELCQGSIFYADGPLYLTNNDELCTRGNPTNLSLMARVVLHPNAIFGSGTALINAFTASGAKVHHIYLDGNNVTGGARSVYRRRAIIAISGNNAQLDHSHVVNGTAIGAVDASSNPSCSGLQITNNFIGYHGIHNKAFDEYGGDFTNGIDLRCSNAYVANNEIRDATDGGISFYGGTNTIIEWNWIANSGDSIWSAFAAAPIYANPTSYSGSQFRNNLIENAFGVHAHVALAVGAHLWCDDSPNNLNCNYGDALQVLNNTGSGLFGWGISAEGMTNATVTGNDLVMTPWTYILCDESGPNYYVRNVSHTSGGTYESGYVNRAHHWPCLDSQPGSPVP